jgi:hypothetical protein
MTDARALNFRVDQVGRREVTLTKVSP